MRKLLALALLGSLTLATGCMTGDQPGDDTTGGDDGKADTSKPNVAWDPTIENIVPKNVHEYLEKYQWGDYHIVFHMSRKWYLLGDQGRGWLTRVGEARADLQEGDPENGVEFLTMHRAMIEHLTERWGDEAVTNDPDGRTTFASVLEGWTTDDQVIAGLEKVGGDVNKFKAGLAKINDFASFATEDEFGTFLQTTLRLSGQVDPNDSAIRFYDRDTTPGAGLHNWLHGQFQDASSPIDVGNPQTNLSNIMFWRIHGWIEAKWKQFEAVHQRTPYELMLYQHQMERFQLHMQLHSDYSETQHATNRPTQTVVQAVKPVMFADQVDCSRLTPGTTTADCPDGN
ncbi:MAG TPA: hypothetical protein VFQ53_10245 [Kofleriaceae bacterium]|nr:hypothetical protein [Kofleriaceae bacterium]